LPRRTARDDRRHGQAGGARAGRAETRRQPTVSTALVSDLPGMLAQRRTIHVEQGEPMTGAGILRGCPETNV